MSAIAARRRLLRPRHRLAVGLTLLALAGMVVLHHSAMPGMASMPGEGICLAVLALGAACALVAGAVTRRATARLRPPWELTWTSDIVLDPRTVRARAGPLYLAQQVLRR